MNKLLVLAFMLLLTTTSAQPAEFFKSDAAQAIKVGAVVGSSMGVLGIATEHMLLQQALAAAKQNLHLISSVDGISVTSVDLIGRGFFQKKQVTIENKMLFKAIIESELIVLEHIAQEPIVSRAAKTMVRHIVVGGFMGFLSNLALSVCKANDINTLTDLNNADPNSQLYRDNQTCIAACEKFKKSMFGNTEFKTILAGYMSFLGTLLV